MLNESGWYGRDRTGWGGEGVGSRGRNVFVEWGGERERGIAGKISG